MIHRGENDELYERTNFLPFIPIFPKIESSRLRYNIIGKRNSHSNVFTIEINTKFYTLFRYNVIISSILIHISPRRINHPWKTLTNFNERNYKNFGRRFAFEKREESFENEKYIKTFVQIFGAAKKFRLFRFVRVPYIREMIFGKMNRWIVVSIHTRSSSLRSYAVYRDQSACLEYPTLRPGFKVPRHLDDFRFIRWRCRSDTQSCSKRDIRLLLYGTRQWMCQSMVQ